MQKMDFNTLMRESLEKERIKREKQEEKQRNQKKFRNKLKLDSIFYFFASKNESQNQDGVKLGDVRIKGAIAKSKIKRINMKNIKKKFNQFRKRVQRNFFIGFGLGLIMSAVMMYLFMPKIEDKNEEMTPSQIIEKAKSYGMKFGDEVGSGEISNVKEENAAR